MTQLVRIWLQCRRPGFDPWVGKIPWRRERLPTPVFWPEECHGLYSPWSPKELDMTDYAGPSQIARVVSLSWLAAFILTVILLPPCCAAFYFVLGYSQLTMLCYFLLYSTVNQLWKWNWKLLSCVQLFVTQWTIQSMELSRPEYWSG